MIARSAFFIAVLAAAQAPDVVRVTAGRPERRIELPGEIQPYQSVAVYARIAGFVEEVRVDRGSQVRKGELLATLAAPELTARRAEAEARAQAADSQVSEAEARAAGAASTLEHLESAAATPGVIAGNELVQARKALEAVRANVTAVASAARAAHAAVEEIRKLEGFLRVTAPFDGVITARNVHPGALAGPSSGTSQPLFQLEQNSRLRLVVAVPEIDVGGIVPGAQVSFTVPAWPGAQFTGRVARAARSLDARTRSMAVEMDVANGDARLAPGMFPSVLWPVRNSRRALLAPPSSIVTTTERTFVVRVRDGMAEWVNVTRGAAAGDLVEVFGPLEEGDIILRRGSDEIREGTRIAATPKRP